MSISTRALHGCNQKSWKINFELLKALACQSQKGGKGTKEFPRTANNLHPASVDELVPCQYATVPAASGPSRLFVDQLETVLKLIWSPGESWIYSDGEQSYHFDSMHLKVLVDKWKLTEYSFLQNWPVMNLLTQVIHDKLRCCRRMQGQVTWKDWWEEFENLVQQIGWRLGEWLRST